MGRESEGGGLQVRSESAPGGSLFPIFFTVNFPGPFFSDLGVKIEVFSLPNP